MLHTFHQKHVAMATTYEVWLVGEDDEHLRAVACAVWEELDRLELLLSRYDGRAEVTRLNREAAERAVRVEVELFEVLKDCLRWYDLTQGYFDVCATVATSADDVSARPPLHERLLLDEAKRTVQFADVGVHIDLGGYGKGYALDALAKILKRYGLRAAFVHGGTSSVLAIGEREPGVPWQLNVRNPWDATAAPIDKQILKDQGFSCSAVFHADQATSDILNPHTGQALSEQAACWVRAENALTAEVLSTALLAMGKTQTDAWLVGDSLPDVAVGWFGKTKV